MSWIEAVLTRKSHREINEELEPTVALSLLTSGDFWRFERYSKRSEHLPPRRDSDGRFSEPAWALVFAFSLISDPELTEEGLNILSEVLTSPEAAGDFEMSAIVNAFAALALSRLNYPRQAIAVTESALSHTPPESLARLFLQQQLTIHLADADRYKDALHSARRSRNALRSWKSNSRHTSTQKDIAAGLSEAIESNIHMLKNVTSRNPKLSGRPLGEPNTYWRDRNSVLEWGFTTYVRDSFDSVLQSILGRQVTRFSDRESPQTALTTYLIESELAGHYRRVLAARALLGKQQASEIGTLTNARVKACSHLIRQSRDAKSWENFLKLLLSQGPLSILAEEVSHAGEEISWPPRKDHFVSLKVAGSLLSKETARHALRVLLDMPSDAHVRDLNSMYLADAQIWPAIRSLIPVADVHTPVSKKMRGVAENGNAHTFSELAATVRVVNWKLVSESERRSWEEWINGPKHEDASLLEQELAQIFGQLGDREPLERYFSGASTLTIPEISTLVDYGGIADDFDLPRHVAENIAELLESELDELMLDAARGSYSFGVVDSILLAGIFSAQYPADSIWPKIRDAILHPHVSASQKAGFLEWISRNPDVFPKGFVKDLHNREKSLLLDQEDDWVSSGARFSAFRFLCALNLLPEDEVTERLLSLAVSESSGDRVEAARSLPAATRSVSASWIITVLEILARDPSPAVRSFAGMAIAPVTSNLESIDLKKIEKVARRCLESEGVWVPLRTLYGLLGVRDIQDRIDISGYRDSISTLASNHLDHSVRETAVKVLRRWDR